MVGELLRLDLLQRGGGLCMHVAAHRERAHGRSQLLNLEILVSAVDARLRLHAHYFSLEVLVLLLDAVHFLLESQLAPDKFLWKRLN